MAASVEFGHSVSLHEVGSDPKNGYGYPCLKVGEDPSIAEKNLELWNSYTPETCPHGRFLSGSKCGLCGKRFTLTRLISSNNN